MADSFSDRAPSLGGAQTNLSSSQVPPNAQPQPKRKPQLIPILSTENLILKAITAETKVTVTDSNKNPSANSANLPQQQEEQEEQEEREEQLPHGTTPSSEQSIKNEALPNPVFLIPETSPLQVPQTDELIQQLSEVGLNSNFFFSPTQSLPESNQNDTFDETPTSEFQLLKKLQLDNLKHYLSDSDLDGDFDNEFSVKNSNNNRSNSNNDDDKNNNGSSVSLGIEQNIGHKNQYRKNLPNTDISSYKWRRVKKHHFVLSSAGKPIYSRFGDESRLSPFMGIIQAIISTISDMNDEIRTMDIGSRKFVFLSKEPLYLVVMSSRREPEHQLILELEYLYDQILSVLTYTQLSRIFEMHSNFDLRRLLSGTENILDNLIDRMQTDPCFMLSSIESLPLKYPEREKFALAMVENKPSSILFGFISYKLKVVSLIRPKKFSLYPSDLHLLFNMAISSSSLHTSEVWTPVCFPRFNNKGFLFVYISMLLQPNTYLYLVTTQQDRFYELFEHRNNIMKRLGASDSLAKFQKSLKADMGYLPVPEKIDSSAVTKWVCFKSRKYVQHVSFVGKHIIEQYSQSKPTTSTLFNPSTNTNANSEQGSDSGTTSSLSFLSPSSSTLPSLSFFGSAEQKRILKMFRYCKKHHATALPTSHNPGNKHAHNSTASTNTTTQRKQSSKSPDPTKLCFFSTVFEQIIGWSTVDFEVYGAFEPESDPEQIVQILNALVKHTRRNAEHLFVTNSPIL